MDWPLPIVPITHEALNPFQADGVEISVVLGYHLPYETLKFLAVVSLLNHAKTTGLLEGVHTLVEATSGAFGRVLAQIALADPFNMQRVVLIINEDAPNVKRRLPFFAGAKILPPEEGLTGIATARMLGKQEGWLNLDQYANPANAILYKTYGGKKVLEQVPETNVFVAPVGTGGTVIGFGEALQNQLGRRCGSQGVLIVGAMCAEGEEVPGVRDEENGMKEITQPWREAVNELVKVKTRPAYLSALWFQWLMGLPIGISGGLDYAGALLTLKWRKDMRLLDELRNKKDGKIRVVILAHDGFLPYVDDRVPVFLQRAHQRPESAPLPWKWLW